MLSARGSARRRLAYTAAMNELDSAQRKDLKARAHKLEPVVHVGAKGMTPAVVAEIVRALEAHELIKVRAAAAERDERELLLAEICTRCGAEPVQHIGKVLVIWRPNPEQRAPQRSHRRPEKGSPRRPPVAARARTKRSSGPPRRNAGTRSPASPIRRSTARPLPSREGRTAAGRTAARGKQARRALPARPARNHDAPRARRPEPAPRSKRSR
jgi:putative YhbY family RNA-binding protein